MNGQQLLTTLVGRSDFPMREADRMVEMMLAGQFTDSQIAALLIALRMKGETVDEILGCIAAVRRHMIRIHTDGIVVDTCGTGGDGKGTFNISTVAALVVAGAGVKVAKHGNRAASSQCGSADVLDALGVVLSRTPKQAEQMLQDTGFTFLFAPLFHPALKRVASLRKELGVRTLFNFLGPFVSPAGVTRQMIGVPDRTIAEKLSRVAVCLAYEHLLLVSGEDGLDEVSLSGVTHVFEVKGKILHKRIIAPEAFGFSRVPLSSLSGGDARYNARIIQRVLDGETGAYRDIVLLNAAFGLYVSGFVKSIRSGITVAQRSVDSGRARAVLTAVTRASHDL